MPDALLRELLGEAQTRGLLGPGPVAAHIRHAEGLAEIVNGAPERFLDLGAGAGVAGLVLALGWPDSLGVLLDSRRRACRWLGQAIDRLSLGARLAVACGRAEDLARTDLRACFDLVAARSFGPPAVTAECAVGFLAEGGRLVVSEPPGGEADRWPAEGLAALGLSGPELRTAGGVTAAVLTRTGLLDDRWPRRAGIPGKRPLW